MGDKVWIFRDIPNYYLRIEVGSYCASKLTKGDVEKMFYACYRDPGHERRMP